jgi:hypothetical protein
MSPANPAGTRMSRNFFLLLESEVEAAVSVHPLKHAQPARQTRAARASRDEKPLHFVFLESRLICLFPEHVYEIVFGHLTSFGAPESLA